MTRPTVWAIGGSDSSGGAGVGADTRTIHGLGAHACTIVTAVTAQSSRGIQSVWPVPIEAVRAQLDAVGSDLPPSAVKIGMLGTRSNVLEAARLARSLDVPVVLDPVLAASAGGSMLDGEGRRALLEELLPAVDVVTPNLDEAGVLLGRAVRDEEAMREAALAIAGRGPRTVIVKGGHGEGALARDCVLHEGRIVWLESVRLKTPGTHGTGCTFASAFAAVLAQGHSHVDAAVVAKMYVTAAIRGSYSAGEGDGAVAQGGWPESPEDLPRLIPDGTAGAPLPVFAPLDRPPGLYAIVDSAEWVERLASSGVGTLQLRVKSLDDAALRAEIGRSIAAARTAGVPLFINDYWQLAIELGAWGVHLGQEDLDSADVGAIAGAGLRLGVSTHCYEEVARAHALRPSYIALGPVFETKIKVMRFAPQGLAALRRWRATLAEYPLVAIGGIDASNASAVRATGVDSIAVIRAITLADDPIAAVRELGEIAGRPPAQAGKVPPSSGSRPSGLAG